MARQSFSYTHGDTGTKPSSSLDFAKNERPDAQNFDWFWYNVTNAISGHADEFDRFDSDDDGVVDESDTVTAGGHLKGNLNDAAGNQIYNDTGNYVNQARLENSSVTVAGNSVALGGSTTVSHADLSNINANDHHARYADEEAQDAVGAILGGNFTYDDSNNAIALANPINVDTTGDADTVDGYHGGDFALAGHSHGYNEITSVSSDDHHTRYSDGEARSAIEAGNVNHVQFANIEDVNAGQIGRDDSIGFLASWGTNGTAVLWDSYNVNGGNQISISGGTGADSNPTIAVNDGYNSGLTASDSDKVDGYDVVENGSDGSGVINFHT